MAHPWHLVMMQRHHEIGPLVKESAALRAFLRYCHGSASFVTSTLYAAPHQQPSPAVSAGAPHEERR
jgi:hypothetical protein